MFSKHVLIATLTGGLTLYLLGWVFYDMIAGAYFEENALMIIPERMDLTAIAIGALVQAFALANIYRWCFQHENKTLSGFRIGAWFGVFAGLGSGMIFYGTLEVHTLEAHLVDALWTIPYYGIGGWTVAWGYHVFRG